MTPQFIHDCDECELFFVDGEGDWYTCHNPCRPRTVICRFSSEPSDYSSSTIGETVVPTNVVMGALARGLKLTFQETDAILKNMLDNELGRRRPSEFALIYGDLEEPAWREKGWGIYEQFIKQAPSG